MADPTQIHQVIMNLCTNAYHAMREKGGILEISLDEVKISNDSSGRDSGSYLQLAVSDTGNGMDPATIKKIFDPYFTTKPRGEGTGLGLSVVHGIMKRHKGYVTVESEPEHGTAFYAYLPLIDSLPDEPAAVSSASFSTGYERILLVDDEEPITEMLRQILERLGYQVTARTSSVEALKAFQSQPGNFDLVITDTTMPNMTGIELCRAITKIRPDIPVVLCTGFSETITEEKADAAGIKGFIMKPVSIREMAGVIRRVLDSGV
jgi:CheY-like chemotaxis protein